MKEKNGKTAKRGKLGNKILEINIMMNFILVKILEIYIIDNFIIWSND